MLLYLILIIGLVGVLFLLLRLVSGPSPSRALKRRMELVKERHAEGVTAAAQAQIRKLMAARASRFEGFA
jgi:tight adherence protein B